MNMTMMDPRSIVRCMQAPETITQPWFWACVDDQSDWLTDSFYLAARQAIEQTKAHTKS